MEEKVVEKEQEEKEEVMKEEERIISVSESNAKENVEVAIENVEEEVKMPAKSSETIISTNSVVVRPTQEYSHPPTNVLTVTPSLPSQVILPDGRTSAYARIMQTIMVPSLQPLNDSPLGPSTPVVVQASPISSGSTETFALTSSPASISSALPGEPKPSVMLTTEHPAVYSRVASPEMISKESSPPKTTTHSSSQRELSAGANLDDITSEEVFEARFKKRESSLSRSLKFLSRSKNEEKLLANILKIKKGFPAVEDEVNFLTADGSV